MADLGQLVDVIPEDVTLGWRELTDEQVQVCSKLIDRALSMLPGQSPGLLDRVDRDEITVEAVQQVIVQAVRRAMRGLLADGRKSGSEEIDDFSESWVLSPEALDESLHFTARELAGLAGPGAARRRGCAYTIVTG